MRKSTGFTLLEIVVVLLLMSIMAAYVLGRSITTSDVEFTSQVDKIRTQIRFAQAEAMKRSDTVWGIKSDSGEYWLFRGTNPGDAASQVKLPGGDYAGTGNKIKTTDMKITLNGFTVFFDRIGKPYSAYTDESVNTPVTAANPLAVTVSPESGGPALETITITPETGLVR